jgi:hypothetical protein
MTKAKTKAKPEKPTRATRRPGKKSIDWREDPEILQRLGTVAQMMNQGRSLIEIAQKTKVSVATAKRDIARVKEFWKEDALDQISNAKNAAIAAHQAVIRQAWEDMLKVPAKHPNRPAFMNVIVRARGNIDKIVGIAERVEHSGPDGAPIPVEVVDLEKIRKKRWEAVAGQLAGMSEKQAGTDEKD